MSYIDELIRLRPELKPLKPHIGNSLADNYVNGLRGRYHTRLDRGIQIATRAKPDQLAGVIEQLLADRKKRGGGVQFNIHNAHNQEQLMRTLILALWTSRVVAPSSVNGTVQVQSKKVYGDEHFMPPISLGAVQQATTPAPELSAMIEPAPAATFSVREAASAGAAMIGSASQISSAMSGSGHTVLLEDVIQLKSFIERAEEIFLHPEHRYTWNEIVSGARVSMPGGGRRKFMAVDRNTFRGFHKINKDGIGAGDIFRSYFVQHNEELIGALNSAQSTDDLHDLLNRVSGEILAGLVNIKSSMLTSYNKIRKPVDLYIEHLVAMAHELDASRERLIPFISLPLDSQMFKHPDVFEDAELRRVGVSRNSTYMEVRSEAAYHYLQGVLRERAEVPSQTAGRPFHPIYFDLLWNNRYARQGMNLFELNP